MKDTLTATHMRWLTLAAWAALVVGLGLTTWRFLGILTTQTGDFVGYYSSAVAVLRGFNAAQFYDDARFFEIIGALGLSQRTLFFPNPPSIPVLFMPFTALSYQNAFLMWSVLNYLLAAGLVMAFVVEAELRGLYRLIFIAMALSFQPIRANIAHGQIYVLIAALVFGSWCLYRRRYVAGFGVSLGLLLIVKVFGIHLWLLAGRINLRCALVVAVAVVAMGVGLSALFTGVAAWETWLVQVLQRTVTERSLVVAPDQSVHGTLGHLLTYDERWNPTPLLPITGLAKPLSLAITLALTALGLWLARQAESSRSRDSDNDIIFAALALLSVVLSPYALDYTYAVALVPLGLWVRWLQMGQSFKMHILVLLGAVMIGASYAAKSEFFESGILVVLAHLKVYGALLLIGLAAHKIWQARRATHTAWTG